MILDFKEREFLENKDNYKEYEDEINQFMIEISKYVSMDYFHRYFTVGSYSSEHCAKGFFPFEKQWYYFDNGDDDHEYDQFFAGPYTFDEIILYARHACRMLDVDLDFLKSYEGGFHRSH